MGAVDVIANVATGGAYGAAKAHQKATTAVLGNKFGQYLTPLGAASAGASQAIGLAKNTIGFVKGAGDLAGSLKTAGDSISASAEAKAAADAAHPPEVPLSPTEVKVDAATKSEAAYLGADETDVANGLGRKGRGRASTILTGGRGLLEDAPTARRRLLGV